MFKVIDQWEECDECHCMIDIDNAYRYNYDHALNCSLHPDNIED